MITITKTELQWIINALTAVKNECLESANNPDLDTGLRAVCQLNADNMLSVQIKLINARDGGSKRIAIE